MKSELLKMQHIIGHIKFNNVICKICRHRYACLQDTFKPALTIRNTYAIVCLDFAKYDWSSLGRYNAKSKKCPKRKLNINKQNKKLLK